MSSMFKPKDWKNTPPRHALSATEIVSGLARLDGWKLTGDGDHTRLQLSYSVGGFIDGGFEKIAPAVESVLRVQLDRLKQFAETGKPTATQ